MSRRRILIDVDGVLADFVGSAIRLINDKLGLHHTRDEVTHWNVWKSLGIPEKEYILNEAVENEFFVKNIEPFPGARDAVERLEREFGNVYVVTSPLDSPAWLGQRMEWIKEHLNVPLKNQIHTKSKHTVAGCSLIDDRPGNLQAWKAHWPSGLPVLISTTYNQNEERFVRTHNWDEVFENIEEHFRTIDKAHH